jgi:cytochrome c oxidase subunit 2
VFKRSNIVAFSFLAVLALFVLSACAEESENPFGTTTPVPAGDIAGPDSGGSAAVEAGPDLANGETKFKGLGCSGCHSTDSNKLVGPGLAGIGSKGDDYIRTSITDPGAVIVDGFNNLMPTSFASLKESDLDDLVAYLNTLN